MVLTGEQIKVLAEFADGDDCQVSAPVKGMIGYEPRSYVEVKRVEDNELVRIYDNGGIERVA